MTESKAWENLVSEYKKRLLTRKVAVRGTREMFLLFKEVEHEWLSILKEKLFSSDSKYAMIFLRFLTNDELTEIFDVLIYFSSYWHGSTQYFHNLVLQLPKDWILDNIEKYVEPILEKSNDEDNYRTVLQLYMQLSPKLSLALAQRAVSTDNPLIRDVGNDFMEQLTNKNDPNLDG